MMRAGVLGWWKSAAGSVRSLAPDAHTSTLHQLYLRPHLACPINSVPVEGKGGGGLYSRKCNVISVSSIFLLALRHLASALHALLGSLE
ncbi:hypothetical protein E2C01_046353 [Portunus trituberculatus]|uniref:Uncharacterized protein n=1 Tax=Portunus trituberculatus TaxID=210409 RepID=A0A5B7G5J3_PORTR|nr:hypothetical protein [Portunus trituberculatus]